MSSPRKVSGIFALLVGLAAVAGVAWWMLRPAVVEKPPEHAFHFVVPVTTVAVVVGDVAERIELVGDVIAPERASLAFERAGRIVELPIQLGDAVQAGAVLARLDDAVMLEEVRASEASLAQSREMASLALREAERLARIKDIGATDSEIDRADASARNEAAKVAQMEADVALQKAILKQGILIAPFDAIVTARSVALGSYVAAGDSCCELLSLERREILLELPPGVAATAQAGVGAGIDVKLASDALPGFDATAKLLSVLPSEEARARTFTGVVRLGPGDDPERRLRPGMFVRASVELRMARGALVVPIDCLIERASEGASLAIVAPGEKPTAAFVPVRVLARDAKLVAVAALGDAKLAAGDTVILVGKENVFPGAALLPVAAPIAPASVPAAGGP